MLTKLNERRVPVAPLLSGTIVRWEKKNGVLVWPHEVLCILKPDIPAPISPEHKVYSPACGRLTIVKPFEKPGKWVRGRTIIAEIEVILATTIV